jgi:hypothetical protein
MATPPPCTHYNDDSTPSYSLRGEGEPAPGATDRAKPQTGPDRGRGIILACVRCRAAITTSAAAVAVSGSHAHTFTNPDGFRFHIGCFSRAHGAGASGVPTTDWTWFPGYAWQIEHCASCAEHLGWRFSSSDKAFHGLILDRLLELEE